MDSVWVKVVLAVFGAGLAAVFGLILGQLNRAVAKIDQMHGKEWQDDVTATLKALPTAERLEKHLAMGHEHAGIIRSQGERIAAQAEALEDHEKRIRGAEVQLAELEGRARALEQKADYRALGTPPVKYGPA